jgi:cold shock CspA family protein
MSQGTVLCYSDTIGYCFIRPDDGGKCIFVHRTKIASGRPEKLGQGDRVTYDEVPRGAKDK